MKKIAVLCGLGFIVGFWGWGLSLLLAQPSDVVGSRKILDTGGFWRYFIVFKTELVRDASGALRPLDAGPGQKEEVVTSALPPSEWREPDFDESGWARIRGPIRIPSSEMALLCLRGKFQVTDPVIAGDLRLSLDVIGGAIVYLNGREIGRVGMPPGIVAIDAPADDYPEEAYLDPEGFLYRNGWGDPEKYSTRLRVRVRSLRVTVPCRFLRKGTNVVAVEIHRAPASELLLTKTTRDWAREKWRGRSHFWWSRLGFVSLTLEAAKAGAGCIPNLERPEGFQIWTHPICQRAYVSDYGDPNEPVRPLALSGARNGVCSGMVVVGSRSGISNLRVVAEPLRGPGGKGLPPSVVQIAYLLPDGPQSRDEPRSFETLSPAPPPELKADVSSQGVVQPIWVRFCIPRDAQPGEYQGRLVISSENQSGCEVPLRLKVYDWIMPDSTNFVSHVGLVQSPDSVALRYGVEMWSEAHWRLIERSFKLLGEAGADFVFIPLIRHTHFGNEHSMVRWIRKNGGFVHDFSLVEKYLAVAVKYLGKPEVVCLYCWEPFTGSSYLGQPGGEGKGMPFTILDPTTGKLEEAEGPKWGSPEVREFWQPVFKGCREILKKLGLESSMMVGMAGDNRPLKNAVDDLRAVVPEAQWVVHSHSYADNLYGVRVGHMCDVWNSPVAPDPAKKRLYGWQNPFIRATFPREGSNTVGPLTTRSPPAQYMIALEAMMVAGIRGMGRVGADFWSVPKRAGESGGGRHILGRYPESGWGQLNLENSTPYVLTPGPEGALPTVRFEMIRWGAQMVEARVFLEKCLLSPDFRAKLGEDRATKIQALLDDRVGTILYARNNGWLWFLSSGWEARDEALLAVASEVARIIGRHTLLR